MSFGFSISDVVLSVNLLHSTYRKCKHAPEKYQEVRRQVRSVYEVWKQLDGVVEETRMLRGFWSDELLTDIGQRKREMENAIAPLEAIILGYAQCERGEWKWIDRARHGIGVRDRHLNAIDQDLHRQTTNLTPLLDRLGKRQVRFLYQKIDEIAADVRSGKVAPTVCSLVSSEEDFEEESLDTLKKELTTRGFSNAFVDKKSSNMQPYLQKLIVEGQFEEQPPEETSIGYPVEKSTSEQGISYQQQTPDEQKAESAVEQLMGEKRTLDSFRRFAEHQRHCGICYPSLNNHVAKLFHRDQCSTGSEFAAFFLAQLEEQAMNALATDTERGSQISSPVGDRIADDQRATEIPEHTFPNSHEL